MSHRYIVELALTEVQMQALCDWAIDVSMNAEEGPLARAADEVRRKVAIAQKEVAAYQAQVKARTAPCSRCGKPVVHTPLPWRKPSKHCCPHGVPCGQSYCTKCKVGVP